ncbi:MAG: VOC family protein [Patescibacteria group bacterium]|nr:VOC family protein [Patescibacteria group bacterium]
MILKGYNQFLRDIFGKLENLKIDVRSYELDHIAYQASSDEDYDTLLPEFEKICDLLSEEVVGGRRVGIFKFKQPLVFENYSIPSVELIAPKQDQICPSALEHAEFVIDTDFDTFLKKYPAIDWDTSDVDQKDFPMIKLKVGKGLQVKFHLESVLDIVEKIN